MEERPDLRPNTGFPARAFARLVVLFRWLVVPGWLAAAAACVLYLPALGGLDRAPLTGLVPGDSPALESQRRSFERFGSPLLPTLVVVARSADGLTPAEQRSTAELALRVSTGDEPALPGTVAVPVLNTARVFPAAREAGTTAVTYLFLSAELDPLEQVELAQRYADLLAARLEGAFVGVTGALAARDVESKAINASLRWIEIATVLVIFAILAVSFRSVIAPLVALLAAGIAFVVSERLVAAATEAIGLAVPREVEPLMIVLLLGIVTDYAVFFLAGTRRRLGQGAGRVQAAWWTGAQLIPIIATAGLIVAAGSATILVGSLDFFRAFGPGMAVTVLVGLGVAVTLIPALLGILGRAAYWPSAPERAPGIHEPTWAARATGLVRHRAVAAVVVAASLAGLALAATGVVRVGLAVAPIRGLQPDAEPAKAYRHAAQGFAPGITAPTEVLLEGEGIAGRLRRLGRVAEGLAELPGVAGVVGPGTLPLEDELGLFTARRGDAARYLVVLGDDPYSSHAIDLVEGLAASLPARLERAGLGDATATLAGDTALSRDAVDAVRGDLLRIGLAVVLVNFVLLALFLRAVIAPLYLVFASGLAVLAAVGLGGYVFHDLLGRPDLTYYVPLAAGVLLVSLGADYNLFVVGRIWQEARRRPLGEAIRVAAPRASRAVTIAGATLAVSFSLLAIVPLSSFREFAFVMAAGILLDTFVVRPFLVPGLIALVGRPSWWPGRPGVRPAAAPGSASAGQK